MPDFSFTFLPSRIISVILVALHLCATLIVLSLAWPLSGKMVTLLLILGSLWYYYQRDGRLALAKSPRYLLYRQGQWWLQTNAKGLRRVKVTSHTVVIGIWIFLSLREVEQPRRYSLWLWAKDYPKADFKQLARLLRVC